MATKAKTAMRGPSEVVDAIDVALDDSSAPVGGTVKAFNVRLPVTLHKAAAQLALDESTKINRLVIEALRDLLVKRGRTVP